MPYHVATEAGLLLDEGVTSYAPDFIDPNPFLPYYLPSFPTMAMERP